MNKTMEGLPGDLQVPGLTTGHGEVRLLAREIPLRAAAFAYKARQSCLWVVFLGGTGTGKSTLFNTLCGGELSRTGVERPKTRGAVAHAYAGCPLEKGFPFYDGVPIRRPEPPAGAPPETGEPGRLIVLDHEREERAHLVVVDTPDLDSLDVENRRIAEELALLADAVVFVASQEKYADEVPSLFLRQALGGEKPVYVLLNKADAAFMPDDAVETLEAQGIPIRREQVWIIPYARSVPDALAGDKGFTDFRRRILSDLSRDALPERRRAGLRSDAWGLNERLDRLAGVLKEEDTACDAWMERLQGLFRETADDLIRAESEHFTSRNRKRIQREIRRLFSRYDLLAGPRRAVQRVLRAPFRLLGLDTGSGRTAPEDLHEKARQPENLAPILAAVDRLNRRVLETLSPADETAPLFAALRSPEAAMARSEVEARVIAEQERLETWLRETFERMSRGLPAAKRWSIYSTSIVWGVLILALEATLGGGFGVVDAVLDSALAPFVTKGSAELFAYREIRVIIRDMAETYRRGIVSILEEQRDRYASAMEGLRTSAETLERIAALRSDTAEYLKTPSG